MDVSAKPTKPLANQPSISTDPEIEKYIQSLDELEAKTYEIARSHLGTSFNIKKSIGFIQWTKKQQDA
jgi:hypothetical protein